MTSHRAAENPQMQTTTLNEWLALISPSGQDAILDFIREAKEKRGAGWLDEIQAEYPTLSWIVELVANHTADEALDAIEAEYSQYPIRLLAGRKIIDLHARLKAEIDKKR